MNNTYPLFVLLLQPNSPSSLDSPRSGGIHCELESPTLPMFSPNSLPNHAMCPTDIPSSNVPNPQRFLLISCSTMKTGATVVHSSNFLILQCFPESPYPIIRAQFTPVSQISQTLCFSQIPCPTMLTCATDIPTQTVSFLQIASPPRKRVRLTSLPQLSSTSMFSSNSLIYHTNLCK